MKNISVLKRGILVCFCLAMWLQLSGFLFINKILETVDKFGNQTITIKTPMVEGVTCNLTDQKGNRWHLMKTPGVVTLKAGHGPITAICYKKGYKKNVHYIEEERVSLDYMDMVEEAASVALDPSRGISKRFPQEVVIWMEPHQWKSKEHLRQWALEKRIYDNKQLALKKAQEADVMRIEQEELRLRTEKEVEYRERMRNQGARPPERGLSFNRNPYPEIEEEDPHGVRPPKRLRYGVVR